MSNPLVRWTLLGSLAVLVATLTPARADENPTVVRARIDGTTAHIRAHYAIDVEAGVVAAAADLRLPDGAVVTGAKITVDGHAHALALIGTAAAEAKFETIRTSPRNGARPWGFALRRDHGSAVTLDVAAPRAAKLALDLELDAPTCFVRDARHIAVPEEWLKALEPGLQRTPVAPQDELAAACGKEEGARSWFAIGVTPVTVTAERAQRLELSDRHIVRAELDVARQLGRIPPDLRTAIVIDSSRSLSAEEQKAQRAIIRAYLGLAPRASVQVIAYARTATPMLEAWSLASTAAPTIDKALAALTLRNGSNVDAGLSAAVTWLARTTGTKRILLFSDERLARRVTDAIPTWSRGVPPDTIVHTIALSSHNGPLVRDDDAVLAPLAAATTGIAVDGAIEDDAHIDATILARPISIDHLTLKTSRWTMLDELASTCEDDRSLAEGSSCTWWGQGGASSGDITIDGLIWNKRFSRTLHPDRREQRAVARVLSGASVFPEEEQREIDEAAAAVNTVWSLFGSWAGAGGYADTEQRGGAGWGSICGCDRVGTIGHGSGTGERVPEAGELREQLAAAVASCHPDGARVELSVETTLQEIVAVDAAVLPEAPKVRDCVVEAVWNVPLNLRHPRQHATATLAYVY